MDENKYKELIKICKLQGCYVPSKDEVMMFTESNMPYWARLWIALIYKDYLIKGEVKR